MATKTEKSKQNSAKTPIAIIKKVGWGIAWSFFGILFVLVSWLAIDKYIIKSPVPSVFGYSTLTIQTGSMNGYSSLVYGEAPKQVGIGDLIVIKKTNDYKIGDVITFLPKGDKIPTTHRIIGYAENGYITKGDANNTKDTNPISKDRVLGEVVGHYPNLGKFTLWVMQEGYLYIFASIAIIILGVFIVKTVCEETPKPATDANAEVETAQPVCETVEQTSIKQQIDSPENSDDSDDSDDKDK